MLPLGHYLRRPAVLATAFAFFGYAYILYFFLVLVPQLPDDGPASQHQEHELGQRHSMGCSVLSGWRRVVS